MQRMRTNKESGFIRTDYALEITIPSAGYLAEFNTGRISTRKLMRKPEFALHDVRCAFLKKWRAFVLVLLIVLTAAFSCILYFHESQRGELAALTLGGTLIGMLFVGFFVCRR